ncbi:MAG: tetratricopeptide repeat protein [Rikenellaceae bacterium]
MIRQKVGVSCWVILLLIISSGMGYAQKRDSVATLMLSVYERVNPAKAASDYYLRGKEIAVTIGNMELAAKYYLKAIANDPQHAATNYELASLAAPNVALPYSLRAYSADTTNYWYVGQLAEIYSALRDYPKAIVLGEKLIKLHPDNDEPYRDLTTYYYYNNQIVEAMAMIDTMKTHFGDNPDAALLHCNMIKNLKEPTAVMVKQVQDYVTFYDDIPNFVIILGDIYIRMGLGEQAVECYKRAKKIDPQDLRGDVALFDYYNRRQNQGEAVKYLSSLFKSQEIELSAKIALYKDMIETNVYLYRNFFTYVDDASMSLMSSYPENMEVRRLYTDHLLRKGDINGAREFNKAGLDGGVYDFESFQTILEIDAYNKNYDSMKVYIDKGLSLFPDKKKDLNMAKASYFSMTKQYPKAIELMEQLIKEASGDSLLCAYYGTLGDLYHAAGKSKQTYKAYDKALKYEPENVIVLNNYSYYLSLGEKDLDRALKMSLIVINKEPSNSTYIDTYAWILYKLKRYNEAREVIAKAVALDTTKSSSLMLHYGDILYKLGQKALAESYWDKALEYGEDPKEIEQRRNQK